MAQVEMPNFIEGYAIHYVAYNGRQLAGMLIGISATDQSVGDLVVFTNMPNVNGVKNFGIQFHQDVAYSKEPKPGTWHLVED